MANANERVQKCAKKKSNLVCFFSNKPGANYALLYDKEGYSLAAFCCEEVVNIVREVALEGLRIKGVSMANFTDAEASLLEVSGTLFINRLSLVLIFELDPTLSHPFFRLNRREGIRQTSGIGGLILTRPRNPE